MTKILLNDTTFIIPIRLESQDRARNLDLSLRYITRHFDTNIIIGSDVFDSKVLNIIENIKKETKTTSPITYVCLKTKNSNAFHRTYLLNSMLAMCKTKITVNYDCDVVLPVESYQKASKMILEEDFDLVYPFGNTQNSQKRVTLPNEKLAKEFIDTDFSLEFLEHLSFDWPAAYGFCQFFKTKSYKNGGGESEAFVAYGPEDVERFERWTKLGYKVGRIDDLVFHFEHSRTPDSSPANIFMKKNESLLEEVRSLNPQEFLSYSQKLSFEQFSARAEEIIYLKNL